MDTKEDKVARVKVGLQLKRAREELGLTQAEVGKKAKVSPNYYSIVERGEGDLSFLKMRRVMKVLGIKNLEVP